MNGRFLRRARWALVAAAACMSLSLVAPSSAIADAGKKETAKPETKAVAKVKVEIKQESGKVIKSTAIVDWGAEGRIELPGDKFVHAVLVTMERDPESAGRVAVTLGYEQDGEAIIAAYEFDSQVKKREVIEIEGGIAIALQITPKKVAVEAPPPEETPSERENKLEVEGDNDDPLGGLLN